MLEKSELSTTDEDTRGHVLCSSFSSALKWERTEKKKTSLVRALVRPSTFVRIETSVEAERPFGERTNLTCDVRLFRVPLARLESTFCSCSSTDAPCFSKATFHVELKPRLFTPKNKTRKKQYRTRNTCVQINYETCDEIYASDCVFRWLGFRHQ